MDGSSSLLTEMVYRNRVNPIPFFRSCIDISHSCAFVLLQSEGYTHSEHDDANLDAVEMKAAASVPLGEEPKSERSDDLRNFGVHSSAIEAWKRRMKLEGIAIPHVAFLAVTDL